MSMSSETEILKTNEFLRRRKLRLQQVREQSKDIAKKIRQRAKVEKLRQIVDLDSTKGRDYLQRQERFVRRLEQLYAQGVKSVGESHKKANEERLNELSPEKNDLSKLRGKEAVAELRRKKQEKLDEQKKLLDRKLLAREAANEISREKSSNVANKLQSKPSSIKLIDGGDQVNDNVNGKECPDAVDNTKVTRNDMATQWDSEELPNEWDPTVPALSLPKDDKESVKDSNIVESKSDKSRRLDLFALSAEMPSSLRGGIINLPEERSSVRPSLTLVSEYLQNRALRLREPDTTNKIKKQTDDLHNIKQTILRSRSSKIEAKGSGDKSTSNSTNMNLTKKNSVTMYNHSTRDSRDVPHGDSRFVVRDVQTDEDAYSQALRETTNDNTKDTEHQNKLQEMRSKVAMTKQTVEKEYNDTMSFLKSLPKEKCTKHVNNAYMDERRQRILKVSRQQKLQQEFNKIEKECRKNCENTRPKTSPCKTRNKSKSPARADFEDDFESRDLQYSWMPVPESDGNLAIHTIPTTVKEGKSGNTVKFSKVDSYHEYRSRHKHTPPTKDTNPDKPSKTVVETVIIQKGDDASTDCSSITSDTSSVDNLNIGKNNDNSDQAMSEADRIIIYKMLDKKQKERKKLKLIDDVAKVLKSMDKEKPKVVSDDNNNKQGKSHHRRVNDNIESTGPIDQVDEGVYKVVSEKGDNISSLHVPGDDSTRQRQKFYLTEEELNHGQPCCCSKQNKPTQFHEKGSKIHCEKGEPGARTGKCRSCKCDCVTAARPHEQSGSAQPSVSTSASSFKTATTDKARDAALPEGGYVKLIDDDGLEAGKFYIGTTGFLKDDAYEVIIQLKKKDAAANIEHHKEKLKGTHENALDKNTKPAIQDSRDPESFRKIACNPESVEGIDKPESNEKEEIQVSNKKSPRAFSQASSTHMNTIDENVEREIQQNSSDAASTISTSESNSKARSSKKFVDKGVHTSFQLSYGIPSHVQKTESIPRPATSTYTQTTMDSPNQRPVFIHMSSSTSTAYMSPPDMVMPNIMRKDHGFQGEKFMTDRSRPCDNYKCTRKRCRCHKSRSSWASRNTNSSKRILNPPPNTARDSDENSDTCDNKFDWPIRKKYKRKCHQCDSTTGSNNEEHHHKHRKGRNVPLRKLSSRNLVVRTNSNTAPSLKNKMNNLRNNNKQNKPDLNPIIKKYINKLLELNREGMKAVEVANQECSSVSTPGSSIIEVPRNLNDKNSNLENKISLEQMKNTLKQKILEEYVKENINNNSTHTCNHQKSRTNLNKLPKTKSVHKVKSLNISKRLLKTKTQSDTKSNRNRKSNPSTSSPSSGRDIKNQNPDLGPNKTKPRSKSSPTPRQYHTFQPTLKNMSSDNNNSNETDLKTDKYIKTNSNSNRSSNHKICPKVTTGKKRNPSIPFNQPRTTSDSEMDALKRRQIDEAAMNISTQTSQDFDSEINLMKLAENKLQNMEKIADLTEKCTKRLSNLAKVLEEVRRNKSLAYSQISTSDTASDSEHPRSEKYTSANKIITQSDEPITDFQDKVNKQSYDTVIDMQDKTDTRLATTISTDQDKEEKLADSSEYIPFLTNIPKPAEFKLPPVQSDSESSNNKSILSVVPNVENMKTGETGKRRDKPPPALSRIHLKHGHDVIPHELSTVVEVDSPMSVKMKNHSLTNTKGEVSDISYRINTGYEREIDNRISASTEQQGNPDLVQRNTSAPTQQNKVSSNDSSDESKNQMMDLKQFSELMLKPFISIQEFAKQCGGDIQALDDGSNLDDIPKDDGINDELSSLHSDGSLPDVIAELLKRKIIAEPFKFDTLSNINSNTVSSESTLSMLALSKMRKDKKKSSVAFQTKGNSSETSDSLSISSNPDLENAFKKMGMGWASSTLKKTKERLALSSSSNTSSSSLSQLKLKGLNDQDIPVLVTDSVLSTTKISSRNNQDKRSADTSRNAEQQTSFTNSMTVKEFLTNELAKKITFTNKSNRNNTEDEFVSLFETKMPDEMKHSQSVREERSLESLPSAQNNRARTSTPVQLFKSMTYHSSSSSNMSNGLFSNADDLSSVKVTSNSNRNHSTSDKDDLTIPNCSLKMRKGASDCSKSE